MTKEAFVYDAIRTPRGRGKKTGSLHEIKPVDLLKNLFVSMEERNKLDTTKVDDCVLGCVSAVGDQGMDIAKTGSLVAGWNQSVGGVTLNRFCGSGLEAVNLAAMKVRSGWEDLVVAGGVESMSRVPMGSDGGAIAFDPATNLQTSFIPQGISADLIATLEGFDRKTVDEFALTSQKKATVAREKGYFKNSIVPVTDMNGLPVLEEDEFIRPDATLEGLNQLKASFEMMGSYGFDSVALAKYHQAEAINHVHTPGNSSGIVDGAALTLIGNEQIGAELSLTPKARIVSTAVVGTEPTIMLTGPAPATLKALKKANLTLDDIDLFEVNEAFAAVVLKFQKELGVPSEKINVNGGAIAMGHPLGATGAMLLGTVIDELHRRDLRYGLVTLCIGGGMGIATVVEKV